MAPSGADPLVLAQWEALVEEAAGSRRRPWGPSTACRAFAAGAAPSPSPRSQHHVVRDGQVGQVLVVSGAGGPALGSAVIRQSLQLVHLNLQLGAEGSWIRAAGARTGPYEARHQTDGAASPGLLSPSLATPARYPIASMRSTERRARTRMSSSTVIS